MPHEESVSLSLPLKYWLRLQSILAIAQDHDFTPTQHEIIDEVRVNFNQALNAQRRGESDAAQG